MSKGTYNVNDGDTKVLPKNDTSYRNCVCAMLIFVSMCLIIIILATTVPFRSGASRQPTNGEDPSNADAIYGQGFRTTKQTTIRSVLVNKLTTTTAKENVKKTTRLPTWEIPPPLPPPPKEPSLRPTTTPSPLIPHPAPPKTTQSVKIIPADITTTIIYEKTTTAKPRNNTQYSRIEPRFGADESETYSPTRVSEKKQQYVVLPGLEKTTESSSITSGVTEREGGSKTHSTTKVPGKKQQYVVLPGLEKTTETSSITSGLTEKEGGSKTHSTTKVSEKKQQYVVLPGLEKTTETSSITSGLTEKEGGLKTHSTTKVSKKKQQNVVLPELEKTTEISSITSGLTEKEGGSKTHSTTKVSQKKQQYVVLPGLEKTTEISSITSGLTEKEGGSKTHSTTKVSEKKQQYVVLPGLEKTTETSSITSGLTEKEGGSKTHSTIKVSGKKQQYVVLPGLEESTESRSTISESIEVDGSDVTSRPWLRIALDDEQTKTESDIFTETIDFTDEFLSSTTTDSFSVVPVSITEEWTENYSDSTETTEELPLSTISTEYSSEFSETTEEFPVTTGEYAVFTTIDEEQPVTIENSSELSETTQEFSLTTENDLVSTGTSEEETLSTESSSESIEATTEELSTTENYLESVETTEKDATSTSKDLLSGNLRKEKREDDFPTETDLILETECKNKACISTISRILSLMNYSKDACHDFYEYSCGGRLSSEENDLDDIRNQFLVGLNRINATSDPVFLGTFKNFYNSCVEHENAFYYRNRLTTVKEIVKNIGQIILDNVTVVDQVTLTKLFAKSILFKSFPILSKVYIDIDSKTGKYILQMTLPDRKLDFENVMVDWSTWLEDERQCFLDEIWQPAETLDLHAVYKAYSDCREGCRKYAAAVENTIVEMDFFSEMDKYNASQAIKRILFELANDVVKIVEKIDVAEIEQATVNQDFEEKKVSDLQNTWGLIDWRLFFEELVGNPITDDMPIKIAFYNKINELMWTLKNRLQATRVYNLLLILYATDIYQNTVMPRRKDDRKEYCLDLTMELFPDVSTYIHTDSRKNLKLVKRQEETLLRIFQILRGDLKKSLKSSIWLEEDDRDYLLKKAQNLIPIFPSRFANCLDEKEISEGYKHVSLTTNFSVDLVALKENRERRVFSLAGKDFNAQDMFCYFLRPFDTKPKSFYANGAIAVPSGLINKIPLDVPGYVLMARVGIHLAQEIGRHFDPYGINLDKMLEPQSQIEYEFLEQRFKFERKRTVDEQVVVFQEVSDLTINREIADNTALRLTSDNYDKLENNIDLPWIKQSFSKEQIFFIAVAQEFCQKTTVTDYMLHIYEREVFPPALRIETMFGNSLTFSQAFACPKGTVMNSEEIDKKQFPYILVEN